MSMKSQPSDGPLPPLMAPTLSEIAAAHPDLLSELKQLDPLRTAVLFAGLLTIPELQSNCLRIEVLVHLSLAYCNGRNTPTKAFVLRSFERLNAGYCGRAEDPAEDVFIGLVDTPRGNYRIFEGLREGNSFHLQRILNVVEGMPAQPPYTALRDSIDCLLKLADAVGNRMDALANMLGNEYPVQQLSKAISDRLLFFRDLLKFKDEELAQLQIRLELLDVFVLNPANCSDLSDQVLGETDLERYPLFRRGDTTYFLLPTGTGSAISRFVIESIIAMNNREAFERALVREYTRLFDGSPLLGDGFGTTLQFQRIKAGYIAGVANEVDVGRILYLIFFVDGLEDFFPEQLGGSNADPDALSNAVGGHFKHLESYAMQSSEFLDGVCLIVMCGFGRAMYCPITQPIPDRWRLEAISAGDLITLSWVSGFERLSLWRLLDAEASIKREGVDLLNINGLLNLVAWSKELNGHLVPHEQMEDGFTASSGMHIVVVRQNALRNLRFKVASDWRPRRVLDSDGCWIRVRKLDKSSFEEDQSVPLYASEEDVLHGRLRGVYIAATRPWWMQILFPENTDRQSIFEHWKMLCVWLSRAAPILDKFYPTLPKGPITFVVTFAEIADVAEGNLEPECIDELWSLFEISTDLSGSIIRINIAAGFDDGLPQEENIAEKMVVRALVAGAAIAAGGLMNETEQETLVERICPNEHARWIHRFRARSFRDFVHAEIKDEPTLIDQLDDASTRIGIGWRARAREIGPEIVGISECTSYLNDTVRRILDGLCIDLKSFNRASFVQALLNNYEAAVHSREIWTRTTRANIAMHDDEDKTILTILEHNGRLNACFVASRILIEASICECPSVGGRNPGRLELCRAMATAMMVHYLGGWSDAIRWKAIEPRIRVTPVGDIHMNHRFFDDVYIPFGRAGGKILLDQAKESYSRLYAEDQPATPLTSLLESQFLDAWKAEFGASLSGMIAFVRELEDMHLTPPKALCNLTRSALVKILANTAALSQAEASAAMDMLVLTPRAEWRVANLNFNDKDWYPWRFRRRLSVLRRPFIQIDEDSDPQIVFTPGILLEALQAMLRWFHTGELPAQQVKSKQMSKWIGHANNVERIAFNSTVGTRMRELGWQVETEMRATKLLNKSFDRDYGDIDVLAWRADSTRVLVMECKDLHYHKTVGEVAEQLSDFRGEIRLDGKSDHLKKHLDRIELVVTHEREVAKTLRIALPIKIEGHLVFKNPVPMQFAWENMANKTRLSLFSDLDQL